MVNEQNIYVIFPCNRESLCDEIVEYIHEELIVKCEGITYSSENIDVRIFNQIVQEECILIIGYEGCISTENCYILGIAHAKNRLVILINILDEKERLSYRENPRYIRKHFLVIFQHRINNYPTQIGKMKHRLHNILQVILVNDFYSILYQKAINLCNELEEKAQRDMKKLDLDNFEMNNN